MFHALYALNTQTQTHTQLRCLLKICRVVSFCKHNLGFLNGFGAPTKASEASFVGHALGGHHQMAVASGIVNDMLYVRIRLDLGR